MNKAIVLYLYCVGYGFHDFFFGDLLRELISGLAQHAFEGTEAMVRNIDSYTREEIRSGFNPEDRP